jgi:hypothetical protein
MLFCCIRSTDRNKVFKGTPSNLSTLFESNKNLIMCSLQNSFTDIARLLSDFFRDLDVVPSDVVAGLVLLRKFQKIERDANITQVCPFFERWLQSSCVSICKNLPTL